MIMARVIIIMYVGIAMYGHKRVRAQTCLGTYVPCTNVPVHKRSWAQMFLGTNVSGHKHI